MTSTTSTRVPKVETTFETPKTSADWRRVLIPASVVASYLALGVVAHWPVLPDISSRQFGRTADYALSAWFIGWFPHAIAHGLNPFYSNAMFVPTGVNLAQNTEGQLLGLLGAPVTAAFGPLFTTNLLMVLAMPVSATAAFLVMRKWNVWLPGAALAGLLYGFSPYMVGQGSDHVVLAFVPIPPFIALTIASILQHKGSAWRLGVQLGLLIVAQYFICPEILVDVVIVTLGALVCVALRYLHRVSGMARAMGRPLLVALPLVVVFLAYPVWMLVAGPQHATRPNSVSALSPAQNDLLSFIVPGPLQHLTLGMQTLANHLMVGPYAQKSGFVMVGSNPDEVAGYIGVLVLVLAGYLVWRSRRSPRMQLATVLFVGTAVLSLGPYLVIDARSTQVPLPFLILMHIPLVQRVFPARFSLEMFGCLAAVIGFGLDDMRRVRPNPRWLTSSVFSCALLAALVVTLVPDWPYATQPAPSLPAPLTASIPSGDPVAITYPYPTGFSPQPMVWQLKSGFTFRLLGGYAHVAAPNGEVVTTPNLLSPSGLQQFLLAPSDERLGPKLVAITRTTLSRYRVRLVLVDESEPGSGPVVRLFEDALGPPQQTSDQFVLWVVPDHS
jgi:hypothetical protein